MLCPQQSCRQNGRGHQIDDCNAGPHQCTCTLLIFEKGNVEIPWRQGVYRVDDPVGEHKKRGKNVARQRGKKDVQDDPPSRPRWHTRPRLNNGPPKKKPGAKETCVLDHMPRFGSQSERKRRRDVPSDQCRSGSEPAKRRLREDPPEALDRRPPEQGTKNSLHELSR